MLPKLFENLIIKSMNNYMTKEAMEYLADLKLHQQELEAEKIRLEHQAKRLDEEIHLLEEAVRKRMEEKKERLKELTNSVISHPQLELVFKSD